jgi:AcrR family transcriptional regulator
MTRLTRAKASAKRRRAILEAALACFLERGTAATTTEDIRVRSRASIGSIYHHFGDKETLAGEIYLDGVRGYQEGFLEELLRHRDARAGIRGTIRYHLRWIRSKPKWARYLLQMREGDAIRSVEGQISDLNRRFAAEIGRWARPHVAAGRLLPLPPDLAAALWLGPAQSFARIWLAGRAETSLDRAARILAEGAWKVLRRA